MAMGPMSEQTKQQVSFWIPIIGIIITIMLQSGAMLRWGGQMEQRVLTVEQVQDRHRVQQQDTLARISTVEAFIARLDERLQGQDRALAQIGQTVDRIYTQQQRSFERSEPERKQ
jgi:TolA-binding protein